MRLLTVKYAGECRKCHASLDIGQEAAYEKITGIFCPGCFPTDPEEIRQYRQARADHKAERYEAWAEKRQTRANGTLTHIRDRFRGDIAFNTQPGHIPLRARVIAQEDRAFESLRVAEGMEQKAARLRSGVRVKGDADARRQNERDSNDEHIKLGSRVHDYVFGDGVVVRVNRLSYTIKFDRGFQYARDKSYVTWRV